MRRTAGDRRHERRAYPFRPVSLVGRRDIAPQPARRRPRAALLGRRQASPKAPLVGPRPPPRTAPASWRGNPSACGPPPACPLRVKPAATTPGPNLMQTIPAQPSGPLSLPKPRLVLATTKTPASLAAPFGVGIDSPFILLAKAIPLRALIIGPE